MRTYAGGNLNKVIKFVLVVIMLFSFAACDGEKSGDPNREIESTTPVTKNTGENDTFTIHTDNTDYTVHPGSYSPSNDTTNETETPGKQTEDEWINLGIISIPSSWTYEIHILDDIVIYGESSYAPISMWSGWLMADSVESVVESSISSERFVFDDGHTGYMLFFDTYISWVREDWMSLNLNHYGDDLIYKSNKDLILKIAKSLTIE